MKFYLTKICNWQDLLSIKILDLIHNEHLMISDIFSNLCAKT